MPAVHYRLPQNAYPAFYRAGNENFDGKRVRCSWAPLRAQLLLQWNRLTGWDLDQAGPDRGRLAQLIQRKYGIASELVENYLRNFERTLPVL